jgi:perosamine synthetase
MKKQFQEIVDFIRELYGEPTNFIPLHAPVFSGNEKKYLEECIDSTFVSSVGKFVDEFEIKMAEYTGAKKAVVCVNGTNALHLALMLVGVERDTEVITQPLTFIATANAISYCGAHPVFLDVDMDTMGLSPTSLRIWLETSTELTILTKQSNFEPNGEATFLRGAIATKQPVLINKKTGRRISACVPMHTFGHPCRIDEIVEICNEYNIPVVEDAAESLGSFYSPREISFNNSESELQNTNISRGKGKHTGTFGKIGVLSFNGNKIITTGGGGMLLFDDEQLAKKAKHLTTQAKVPHPWEFIHDEIGYNFRMPNINAALGLAQLEQLLYLLESKRKVANTYKEFFNNFDFTSNDTARSARRPATMQPLPPQPFNPSTNILFNPSTIHYIPEPPHSHSNYWLNCILMPSRKERDAFLKYSNENGVMTRPAWELMNRLSMFINAQCGVLSNSEWIANRLVNIPSSAIL